MSLPTRLVIAAVGVLTVALATTGAISAALEARPKAPVIRLKNERFGFILATRAKLPLYYWSREKRAGGQVRCTGRCAVVWPPVLLKRGQVMSRRLPGVRGTFGVVRRPDGRRQVTHNGLPLYAYHDDPPNTVLCNNVDGWFVVRA